MGVPHIWVNPEKAFRFAAIFPSYPTSGNNKADNPKSAILTMAVSLLQEREYVVMIRNREENQQTVVMSHHNGEITVGRSVNGKIEINCTVMLPLQI